MSRRDDLHYPVRRSLEKEGWTITHDPIVIAFRDLRLKVDLGAERYFAAEKEGSNSELRGHSHSSHTRGGQVTAQLSAEAEDCFIL
jgi:hypothetical protein